MRSRAVALLSLVLLAAALPAAAEECADCHELKDIVPVGAHLHPPFEEKDCTSCHEDHGDRETLVLKEGGNAMCADCHEFAAAPFLAAHRKIRPTGKAPCWGCHDPHGSRLPRLQRPLLHEPVRNGKCESCHRSDGRLLIPLNRDFCFLCHKRADFSRAVMHEPVLRAQCLECHDPHGARDAKLLRGSYALEREIRAGAKDYALCLRCHRGEAFTSEKAGGRTRFADGERNLHAVHVRSESHRSEKAFTQRGLTCRTCHEAHSAFNTALTRKELDCGASLCLKLEYQPAEGGGSCLASCHGERMRYTRAAPAPTP